MDAQTVAALSIYIIDILLVIGMVFLERKDPKSCLGWAFAFLALPVVSWFVYIMVGKGPKFSKRRWAKRKKRADHRLQERFDKTNSSVYLGDGCVAQRQLIRLNTEYAEAPCLANNSVEFFIDAHEMYARQLEDIKEAKKSINVMYYLFKPDAAGKAFRDALTAKARQGVKVNLVYDSSGNLRTRRRFFRELIKAGGQVRPFFPSIFKLINRNFTYRNHRKIVVVDGQIGYIGGMNIGVDYLSQDKRIKPWRDTHLRIVGEAVTMLQARFLKDFTCSDRNPLGDRHIDSFFGPDSVYFQPPVKTGSSPVQIISSGPDMDRQEIKFCYEKIIAASTREIYLETPYFIPDDSFLDAILLAQASGVQVYLVIPAVWDKKIVYHVTVSYLEKLLEAGVKVYLYPGFIHSKMVVGDEICASVGTANLDIRSFSLNFEVNAVLYGHEEVVRARDICRADIAKSREYTLAQYRRRGRWNIFVEAILRLFSPLM